jgi:hypothetical protein
MDQRLAWKAVGAASGFAAGALARKVLTAAWQRTTGGDPPASPASPRTTWLQALTWAATSGIAIAISRLVAQRGAAAAGRATTGAYPAGLDEVRA